MFIYYFYRQTDGRDSEKKKIARKRRRRGRQNLAK
jgi:hypothetical protein